MARTKHIKGEPTALNIFALADVAATNGLTAERTFANRIAATDAPHLRRCLKAGLVEVLDRATLRLTDAGVAAVKPELAHRISLLKGCRTLSERQQRDLANLTAAYSNLGGTL